MKQGERRRDRPRLNTVSSKYLDVHPDYCTHTRPHWIWIVFIHYILLDNWKLAVLLDMLYSSCSDLDDTHTHIISTLATLVPAPKICTQIDYKISIHIGNECVDHVHYKEIVCVMSDTRVGIV